MGHGHPQDCELVRLACKGAAGGHHVGQLRDVGGHLVAAPALDFAMVLPAVGSKDKHRSSQEHIIREVRYSFGERHRPHIEICEVAAENAAACRVRCSPGVGASLPRPWEQDGSRHDTTQHNL